MMIILAKCCCIFMATYWTVLSALLYYTRDPSVSVKTSLILSLSGANETIKGLEKEPSENKKKTDEIVCSNVINLLHATSSFSSIEI